MWRWWPWGRQGSDRSNGDPVSREKQRALKLFGEPVAEEPHPYAIDPVVVRPAQVSAWAPPQRSAPQSRLPIMIIGIIAGAIFGLLLFVDDPKLLLVGPRKWLADISGTTGYIDCAHVRLAGAAPLKKGDKGYSKRLDVDRDGVACESILTEGEKPDAAKDEAKPARKKKKNRQQAG